MSQSLTLGPHFAAAVASLAAGSGTVREINLIIGAAAVGLVLADAGHGSLQDQNVLVAAIAGAGRARTRLDAGHRLLLDCAALAPIRYAGDVLTRIRAASTALEISSAIESVLARASAAQAQKAAA